MLHFIVLSSGPNNKIPLVLCNNGMVDRISEWVWLSLDNCDRQWESKNNLVMNWWTIYWNNWNCIWPSSLQGHKRDYLPRLLLIPCTWGHIPHKVYHTWYNGCDWDHYLVWYMEVCYHPPVSFEVYKYKYVQWINWTYNGDQQPSIDWSCKIA